MNLLTSGAYSFIERHDLSEYRFIGAAGSRATTNADKLLNLVSRRVSPEVAALFAVPRFDERGQTVTWLALASGTIRPFVEHDDDAQDRMLSDIEQGRGALLDFVRSLRAEAGRDPDSHAYAGLLPLMLSAPEPLEYQIYVIGGRPVIVCWGMQKVDAPTPGDQLGPFIQDWRGRIQSRRRQALETMAARERERTFLARLTRAGARSGLVDISLMWNDVNDLDLHVICPDGSRICFENKMACGGILDVDRNAFATALTPEPVENITWSSRPSLRGAYQIGVHFFRQHDPARSRSAFVLRLSHEGQTKTWEGEVLAGEMKIVSTFKS